MSNKYNLHPAQITKPNQTNVSSEAYRHFATLLLFVAQALYAGDDAHERANTNTERTVDAGSLRGKVLCGYQGWFRCPGDAANLGWIHWSRDSKRIMPQTLTFALWPDMSEYSAGERFLAAGFTYPDGRQAELFSSDQAATVQRHFGWMREYGMDGVWLQHFVVDLPGGPGQVRYATRRRTLAHVRQAAHQSGRVWALTFDIAGMPTERIFESLTTEWQKLVDEGIAQDSRYLHEGSRPVVQVWGFYDRNANNAMTAALANQLIDFFKRRGPYAAYLVGGGDWDWRRNPDPAWQAIYRRFDAYSPWNTGNVTKDADGTMHATTNYWAGDKRECQEHGMLWLPVVYPGFNWDHLQQKPPGTTNIPRRGGMFLWEQFHALSQLGADSACVAMFDEVDEGTAVFKVTNAPPNQAHFVTYEGMPSDWYLRLVGEGTRLLREKQPIGAAIPIKP